jgi:hypothetical protein
MKQLLLLITFLYCTLSYSQCGNRYVDSLFEVEKTPIPLVKTKRTMAQI